jgi:hypothetical protein
MTEPVRNEFPKAPKGRVARYRVEYFMRAGGSHVSHEFGPRGSLSAIQDCVLAALEASVFVPVLVEVGRCVQLIRAEDVASVDIRCGIEDEIPSHVAGS